MWQNKEEDRKQWLPYLALLKTLVWLFWKWESSLQPVFQWRKQLEHLQVEEKFIPRDLTEKGCDMGYHI